MILTTDDMCAHPDFIKMWKEYWDPLKKEFPHLHVLAYTIPMWKGESKYRIDKNQDFIKWYQERKDWVTLAMHGCKHEGEDFSKLSWKEQKHLIDLSYDIMKDYLPKRWGFKPPYYKFNEHTLRILDMKIGCRYVDLPWRIIISRLKTLGKPDVIESHTSPFTAMPDRIDKVVGKLRDVLLRTTSPDLNEVVTSI